MANNENKPSLAIHTRGPSNISGNLTKRGGNERTSALANAHLDASQREERAVAVVFAAVAVVAVAVVAVVAAAAPTLNTTVAEVQKTYVCHKAMTFPTMDKKLRAGT
ncbi:hypothetical protein KCU71_g1254, partial [Aureobasidium melanogenum]